ncbi:MAG: hypothetical protein N3E37_04385 [Candidatus Micrarchaeota archaeon]|nr:hypothetical protein [Candidatus Micrarchaeota archaeon]
MSEKNNDANESVKQQGTENEDKKVTQEKVTTGDNAKSSQESKSVLEFPKDNRVFVIGILVTLIIFVMLYFELEDAKIIRDSDIVIVNMIVADAQGNIIENSTLNSVPINVNTSSDGIAGLISNNLINKRVGDTVIINVPKELNFIGNYDPSLLISIPISQEYDITEKISEKDFLELTGLKEIKVNRTFYQNNMQITVIDYDNSSKTVTIQYIFLPNQLIYAPVLFKLKNSDYVTMLPAIVRSVNDNKAVIDFQLEENFSVKANKTVSNIAMDTTNMLIGRVVNKTNTYFIIDFNQPYVGKDLILKITVEKKQPVVK